MTSSAIPLSAPRGVLVASASSSWREQVMHSLPDRRWPVQEVMGGAEALVKLESGNWQLLFLDRRLPDLDAEELIQIIQRRFPGIEVVVLDSDSGRPVSLSMQGWLEPPCGPSAAIPVSISAPPSATSSFPHIVKTAASIEPLPGMIGTSEVMQRVYRLARLVASNITTVLITGPTGTGKELVARALHKLSPRASRAFVVVNCAAIPESLLESELFGYVRGAFTGAVQTNPGRILAAQGGTLFLDEVGELPLSLQAKLLRFLDQKEIQRLGSAEVMHADVRVVAATNADLGRAVDERKFRGDLFYRLAAFPLELPALKERQQDVVPLAEHFLRRLTSSAYGRVPVLSHEAMEIFAAHEWEGNVRELQQVIERATILADGGPVILPEHIYFPAGGRRRIAGGQLLPLHEV